MNESATISIFDLNGRVVWSENSITSSIDVSQLAAGTYFLQVQNAKAVQQLKFVKL